MIWSLSSESVRVCPKRALLLPTWFVDHVMYPSLALLDPETAPLILGHQMRRWHQFGKLLWKQDVPGWRQRTHHSAFTKQKRNRPVMGKLALHTLKTQGLLFTSSADSVLVFKSSLRTHLFEQAFSEQQAQVSCRTLMSSTARRLLVLKGAI